MSGWDCGCEWKSSPLSNLCHAGIADVGVMKLQKCAPKAKHSKLVPNLNDTNECEETLDLPVISAMDLRFYRIALHIRAFHPRCPLISTDDKL